MQNLIFFKRINFVQNYTFNNNNKNPQIIPSFYLLLRLVLAYTD